MKKLLKILLLPLSFVNACLPKGRNRVFFYANLGFRDNVQALYDFMIESNIHRRKKLVVATDEWAVFARSAPPGVRFVSLTRGLWPFMRSRYCFYCFGKYPIRPGRGQIVVNLWHGMPLKRIGRMETGRERERQNYFTRLLATSPFYADVMCRSFGAAEKQILLSQQPRCDLLFRPCRLPSELCGFDRLICWLPTFRRSERLGREDGAPVQLGPLNPALLRRLEARLSAQNMLLCIKLHPMEGAVLPKSLLNIRFVDESFLRQHDLSLYGLLSQADALLTDYSSVFFDFLLLDRPIGFVCPDMEDYRQRRGFIVEDPTQLMPGPLIGSPEQLEAFLTDLSAGRDSFQTARRRVRQRCCHPDTGPDAGCCGVLRAIDFEEIEEKT